MDLKRNKDESELQYIWRICSLKDSGTLDMTWDELAVVLNENLHTEEDYLTSSAYRKKFQQAKAFYEEVFAKRESDEYIKELKEQARKLEREKIQVRDERNAWRKQNYIDARTEQKLDYLEKELLTLGKVNFAEHSKPIIDSNREMIILLSDLHIGQTFDSIFGHYDTDIAKDRLAQYLAAVKEYAEMYHVRKAHIVGLGDLVSGNIHLTIQVTNRENVIEQIKTATELITSFCYECTKIFEVVQFYNVSGNHSRMTKKEDAIHDERLDDVIGWAVNLSLNHIDNFHYMKHRNIDSGIADLSVCNKTYLAVHGDFDAMTKSGVSNLCTMLGFIPEGILRGHMHYSAFEDINGVKVVQGGSLAGCGDQYTVEKRLVGKPSQTICICDNKGIKAHIPVVLD